MKAEEDSNFDVTNNLRAQHFQNIGGSAIAQQAISLAGYQAGSVQQQVGQMPGKGMPDAGPANLESPLMNQGRDGGAVARYRNPNGPIGGSHALQDFQMLLMCLKNKIRRGR